MPWRSRPLVPGMCRGDVHFLARWSPGTMLWQGRKPRHMARPDWSHVAGLCDYGIPCCSTLHGWATWQDQIMPRDRTIFSASTMLWYVVWPCHMARLDRCHTAGPERATPACSLLPECQIGLQTNRDARERLAALLVIGSFKLGSEG